VLDAIFEHKDAQEERYFTVFSLRFVPTYQVECEIVIRRSWDRVEVTEYRPIGGNVYSRLNEEFARGAREDADELAKHYQAEKILTSVPLKQFRTWHKQFLNALSRSVRVYEKKAMIFDRTREESVAVHGSYYDLGYRQGANTMSLRLYDQKASSRGEFEVVRWMNNVRLTVEKLSIRSERR
jgi:hypothetical protein